MAAPRTKPAPRTPRKVVARSARFGSGQLQAALYWARKQRIARQA